MVKEDGEKEPFHLREKIKVKEKIDSWGLYKTTCELLDETD